MGSLAGIIAFVSPKHIPDRETLKKHFGDAQAQKTMDTVKRDCVSTGRCYADTPFPLVSFSKQNSFPIVRFVQKPIVSIGIFKF